MNMMDALMIASMSLGLNACQGRLILLLFAQNDAEMEEGLIMLVMTGIL